MNRCGNSLVIICPGEALSLIHILQYDDHSFQYPAYVANAGYDFCYEYALINTDERQIIYVYAMNTLEQDIKFEAEYLPDYFMEGFADFSETGLDRFTMYERYHNE